MIDDKYFYIVYGQIISSPFPMAGLIEVDPQKPDIRLQWGETPLALTHVEKRRRNFEMNEHQILLWIPNVGRFLIENGQEVTLEADHGVSENILRIFILGSVLGAALHQKKSLVLHASAVTNGRQTIVVCGRSGAGKSTLASAALAQGYQLLCDDVAAIKFYSEGPYVMPAYPFVKLWSDSVDKLKIEKDKIQRMREDTDKFYCEARQRFFDKPSRITHILMLGLTKSNLSSAEKIILLRKNIYKKKFIKENNISSSLQFCAELVRCCHIYGFDRELPLPDFKVHSAFISQEGEKAC